MDQQAANLLATLKRPAAPSDAKVNLFNALKSDIKHYRVPETAQASIFECIKLAITQQASSTLASSAFSTLGHLVKRLKIQDAAGTAIVQLAPRLFPALHDRLGDLREQVRAAASQALTDLYPFCAGDVEQIIIEEAIGGHNARAKETGMRWVVRMHKEEGMPFKTYVGPIVAHLEDADGTVREAAKSVLIELFADAPDRAKVDLKRQLKAYSVRHAIESQIIAQIAAPSGAPAPARAPAAAEHSQEAEPEPARAPRARPTAADHAQSLANSINSEAAQPPPQEVVPMDPVYVHSQRELEDLFRDMLPHFAGKEDEHNWMPRDKSVTKLRRLLKGNAPNDYHHAFMAGIKSMVEGILKAANSLRTTMSSNACQLVRELASTLGPALDPHVEILLQSFIKMSANTKHIAAENGKSTTDAIFQNCTFHVRMLQHIWMTAQEKNVQQRQCVPEWLRTILKRQANYRGHFESSGALELAEKIIKKGVDDANPKVKEGMRATYWTFAKSWPEKAEAIISKLDPKTRTALEKDPNNPNAFLHNSQTLAPPTSRPGGASSRSTLREVMAEQRKAKAAGRTMDRPNSAMELSPSKSKSISNLRTAARAPSNLSSVQRSESRNATNPTEPPSSTGAKKTGSSLMSGPVRRPRRAEIQRPQTADPYASRRMLRPETPGNASPLGSPHTRGTGASKASMPTSSSTAKSRAAYGSPAGSLARHSPMTGHGHASVDSRPTSKGSITSSRAHHQHSSSHNDGDDDTTTLAAPHSRPAGGVTRGRNGTFSPGHYRGGPAQTMSVDNGIVAMNEDEGFTMVLPNMLTAENSRQRSPLAMRSPMKAMFDEARERATKLSPEAQRVIDDAGRVSPDRQGASSPSKNEEVQIYEDPFTEDGPQSSAADDRRILGELPVNENVRLRSPTQSVGSLPSPTDSPRQDGDSRSAAADAGLTSASTTTNTTNGATPGDQDRNEVLRNRRLLASGIERIRSKTLDAHGFRRVQDLAKCRLDIWEGGSKYDELMAVLLEYLQSFDREAKLVTLPPAKAAGLKAQALGSVRALLTVHRKAAASWHARALLMVLVCRRGLAESSGGSSSASSSNSHVLADLQRTADDIVAAAAPATCIDALLTHLPTEPSPRAVGMALELLRHLLLAAKDRDVDLGADRKVQLACTAAAHLADADAEVRKADVDLASELFEAFGPHAKEAFWGAFKGVEEGRLGLLTYYIAKKGKAAGVNGNAPGTATTAQ